MAHYMIKSKKLPLDDSWDVIVVGGGPAGCAAAIAAAREGTRTLLIEATGCLGGMATSGLVPAWAPFSDGEKILYRGIAQTVFQATKSSMAFIDPKATDWVPINAEKLKGIYDQLASEYGVHVLFHTSLSAVEADQQGNVEAILVSNKSGLTAYKAKVYIDCTGDADLSAWAGAGFHKGDPVSSELQPATLCFTLSNVNERAYLDGPVLHPNNPSSPIYDILNSGNYPDIKDVHICSNLVAPGSVGFNAGHMWNVDATDPADISRAMTEGRSIAAAFLDALAHYHPEAFRHSVLSETAVLPGIRESRRIIGDYCLTVDDYLNRKHFLDEICLNCYYIDIHNTESETENVKNHQLQVENRYQHYQRGESHGIPYRCLIPQNLHNVLTAGRSISCERPVQASIRVMPVCLNIGEAAGTAAAIAVKINATDVRQVNPPDLRQKLRIYDAYLPDFQL